LECQNQLFNVTRTCTAFQTEIFYLHLEYFSVCIHDPYEEDDHYKLGAIAFYI